MVPHSRDPTTTLILAIEENLFQENVTRKNDKLTTFTNVIAFQRQDKHVLLRKSLPSHKAILPQHTNEMFFAKHLFESALFKNGSIGPNKSIAVTVIYNFPDIFSRRTFK